MLAAARARSCRRALVFPHPQGGIRRHGTFRTLPGCARDRAQHSRQPARPAGRPRDPGAAHMRRRSPEGRVPRDRKRSRAAPHNRRTAPMGRPLGCSRPGHPGAGRRARWPAGASGRRAGRRRSPARARGSPLGPSRTVIVRVNDVASVRLPETSRLPPRRSSLDGSKPTGSHRRRDLGGVALSRGTRSRAVTRAPRCAPARSRAPSGRRSCRRRARGRPWVGQAVSPSIEARARGE